MNNLRNLKGQLLVWLLLASCGRHHSSSGPDAADPFWARIQARNAASDAYRDRLQAALGDARLPPPPRKLPQTATLSGPIGLFWMADAKSPKLVVDHQAGALPAEMKADPTRPFLALVITEKTTKLGEYRRVTSGMGTGITAQRTDLKVYVLQLPERKWIGWFEVIGPDPSRELIIRGRQGPIGQPSPEPDVIAAIKGRWRRTVSSASR